MLHTYLSIVIGCPDLCVLQYVLWRCAQSRAKEGHGGGSESKEARSVPIKEVKSKGRPRKKGKGKKKAIEGSTEERLEPVGVEAVGAVEEEEDYVPSAERRSVLSWICEAFMNCQAAQVTMRSM